MFEIIDTKKQKLLTLNVIQKKNKTVIDQSTDGTITSRTGVCWLQHSTGQTQAPHLTDLTQTRLKQDYPEK